MPIVIKSCHDVARMRAAGRVVADVHAMLQEMIVPGVTTAKLNDAAHELIEGAGGVPSFLDYHGYPKSICTSVGSEVVHGIPGDRVLEDGEIVSVDVGVHLEGFHGDAAATYLVGQVASDVVELVLAAEHAFVAGLTKVRAGNRLGDVSAKIQEAIEGSGYGVVRGYGGHGIGRRMHEDPSVPNHGTPGTGPRLQAGMTLAIEPMLTLGVAEVVELEDGWTVVTADGLPSAHYEHTVLVTSGEPELLTQR